MVTLQYLHDQLAKAERILILAGAGMSAELAVPTYWEGPNAKYAAAVSPHGYTELEHADAGLWHRNPRAQHLFFQERYTWLNQIDVLTSTSPYQLLITYLKARGIPHFAMTSNVDSFFLRAGVAVDNLREVHGAYRNSQCLKKPREHGVFPTDPSGTTMCPTCGGTTRPNVLFFNDFQMNPVIIHQQLAKFDNFRNAMVTNRDVVLEIGAGNTVPTIRNMSVILNGRYDLPVIRINPHLVQGVDGVAAMIPKSKTASFVHVRQPVGKAFELLLQT